MRAVLSLLCLALLVAPLRADAVAGGVTVTVMKRAPIETLSAAGEVTGVTEATPGAKLSLVSCAGTQLTVQDAQGVRYRMSAAATDYTPPASAPAPKAAAATVAPAAPKPSPTPVPPRPSAATVADAVPAPTGDVVTMPMDDRPKDNIVAIWPPGGIADRPLLIAAHGNGGSGPGEIRGWLALAKQHRFTVVCPTLESAVNTSFIPSDEPYFRHILRWIDANLQYDKTNAYMTGFSGGGMATWYFATQRPDFFRGLFLQSGNFYGALDGFSLSRWFDRPIEVIWGSHDLPNIVVQGQQALDTLKAADCKNVVHTVIAGAGHQEHPDLVVTWMEQQVAAQATASH